MNDDYIIAQITFASTDKEFIELRRRLHKLTTDHLIECGLIRRGDE